MDPLEKLYEQLGRKQEQIDNLLAEYRSLLGLVMRLKTGAVRLDDVKILPGDSWKIEPTAVELTAEPDNDVIENGATT